MNIEFSRGYFNPPRLLIVILVLCCLSFVQCSKGGGVIAPITPSQETGIDISDGINQPILRREKEPPRNSQSSITGYHDQVSPFMPEEALFIMEDALSAITIDPLEDGDFHFLYFEPDTLSLRI